MLTEPLRVHIRHSISVFPQTWWSPAVGWMKACLQQPMFCSRESTNCLMIQQNEKSTQKSPFLLLCQTPSWVASIYVIEGNLPPRCPISGMFQASSPLSKLFCPLAQDTKAAILQSEQFLKAAMTHSRFYNCSCSQFYQNYKCGPNISPFKQMLGNMNPNLRALRGKCELH